jgi:hypothetical protein
MSQEEGRTVYELERDGRKIYCDSAVDVSWLLARGWTLSDSGHWAELVRRAQAGSPPS